MGLLTLLIINCSIDAPDFNNEGKPEDLSINDQESIIEVIVEKVLGFEDAIAEHEDNDEMPEKGMKKFPSFYFLNCSENPEVSSNINIYKKKSFNRYKFLIPSTFIETQSPPPEV